MGMCGESVVPPFLIPPPSRDASPWPRQEVSDEEFIKKYIEVGATITSIKNDLNGQKVKNTSLDHQQLIFHNNIGNDRDRSDLICRIREIKQAYDAIRRPEGVS